MRRTDITEHQINDVEGNRIALSELRGKTDNTDER